LAADIIYTSSGSLPLSPNDIAKGILSWLHWNRFRTPLWQDGLRAKFGDIPASKRITQTIGDYDERRSNPNWQPRFKTDLDHAAIFEMGLALGLEVLNEEELADCFDALCPCGCPHSPDALRKQRDRFVHDLRKALVWELEVGPKLIKGSATRQS
jgi:hypothetical protein